MSHTRYTIYSTSVSPLLTVCTNSFGDERLTAALLDRLTHHAHIVELTGESFRFRQRMQEKEV